MPTKWKYIALAVDITLLAVQTVSTILVMETHLQSVLTASDQYLQVKM